MDNLLKFLVQGITGSEDVKIESEENNGFINFRIVSPKEFIGLIVGKSGKTVRSIRNIVKVRAILEKKAVGITVEEAV